MDACEACAVCAGIAGVYDIETHYQYEYGRGVAELSTMKRAMGGRHKFASQSPALILSSSCGRKAKTRLPAAAQTAQTSRQGLLDVLRLDSPPGPLFFCILNLLHFAACLGVA